MKCHPGGETHTRRMLALAALSPGASVLDLGAGAGESVRLLRELGFMARGLDIEPRSPLVETGDLLCAPFPDESFDAVLSQCAFFVSGDVPGALREAKRLLKSGGRLLLSDVEFTPLRPLAEAAGFTILHDEDMTALWREYYLEALWRDEDACRCELPRRKCCYRMLIAERR
ncbi:MAG: class I SAM-dependent methyltransferase [Oscillospiraceae bacterium]|nr:class I SAM-dependent methyltransferase [Oscillospiraceae bacterium]